MLTSDQEADPARAAQCQGSGHRFLSDRLACGLGSIPQESGAARLPPRGVVWRARIRIYIHARQKNAAKRRKL